MCVCVWGGGVNCSRQASLSQLFSLLISDHFVPPITENLFFLNEWKKENIHDRICSTQMSISGLFVNDWDVLLTQLQCPTGCHGHHAILCNPNRVIFGDNIVLAFSGPKYNFASMSNFPWVQGKSNKPPSHEVCVCVKG